MYEVECFDALLEACHEVLRGIENRDDEVAEAIREKCRTVEARLRELGVSFAERSATPS
jgi:phosphate uptake regulator